MAIPLYHFINDDESRISFNIEELKLKEYYDTSVPHRHNYYEIFFFEQGGGTHNIDFSAWDVNSYSLHFVSPGQVHLLQRKPGAFGWVLSFSREFYYLNLHDKNLLFEMPFLNDINCHPVLNLQKEQYLRCQKLTQQMRREYLSGGEHSDDLLRSYLNILLIECKRLFDVNITSDGSELFTTNNIFSRFSKALERNFIEKHKVQDYAEMLGVSDKQLTSTVRQATGKSALEHIHSRLMLEAKRLLLHTELSNKEIAYFLHFDDPSHFGKFFKIKCGITPNEYRMGGVRLSV